MTHRIVVGFDNSPSATSALKWAETEARLRNTELLVITVIEQSTENCQSQAALQRPRAEQAARGEQVPIRYRHGDAAKELVAACTPADLLVVGSHGRGRLVGLFLGSVSQACVTHATCPVVVVRSEPPSSHGRVVVGVDVSGHSRTALRVAYQEACLRGAQLDVVHVVRWERSGAELLTPTAEQLVEWGQRLVETELATVGVKGNPVVVHDYAPDELVRRSSDADLLVVGQRGHRIATGPPLGSVSGHCVRHAMCPVMVTKSVEDSEPAEAHMRVAVSSEDT